MTTRLTRVAQEAAALNSAALVDMDPRQVPTPTIMTGDAFIREPPEVGEVVAYISSLTKGARTVYLISLGCYRGMWTPVKWPAGQPVPKEQMELALEYLVNADAPFTLSQPFGKYRHGDHKIYIDCQPLNKLKAVLRKIPLLPDGRVHPNARIALTKFFESAPRWSNMVADTNKTLMGASGRRMGDVVFPLPSFWAPLGTPEEAALEAQLNAGDVAGAAAAAAAAVAAPPNPQQQQEQGEETPPTQLPAPAPAPPAPVDETKADGDEFADAAATAPPAAASSSSASAGTASAASSAPSSPGREGKHGPAPATSGAAAADDATTRSPPPTPTGTASPQAPSSPVVAAASGEGQQQQQEEDIEMDMGAGGSPAPSPRDDDDDEEEGQRMEVEAPVPAPEPEKGEKPVAAASTKRSPAREWGEEQAKRAEEEPVAKKARVAGAAQEGEEEEKQEGREEGTSALASAAAAPAAVPKPERRTPTPPRQSLTVQAAAATAAAQAPPQQQGAVLAPIIPSLGLHTPGAGGAAGATGAMEPPFVSAEQRSAATPAPDQGWVWRVMCTQMGLDIFRQNVEQRRVEYEAMAPGEVREMALWACGQLRDHADNCHQHLAAYLELAILDGSLPPMIGSTGGDARTLALWKLMIDCLSPIARNARVRAFTHLAANRLPPPNPAALAAPAHVPLHNAPVYHHPPPPAIPYNPHAAAAAAAAYGAPYQQHYYAPQFQQQAAAQYQYFQQAPPPPPPGMERAAL